MTDKNNHLGFIHNIGKLVYQLLGVSQLLLAQDKY